MNKPAHSAPRTLRSRAWFDDPHNADMTALYTRKIRELRRSGADPGSVSSWEYLTAESCLHHGEVVAAATLFEGHFTRQLATYPATPSVTDSLHEAFFRHEMATYYLYNTRTQEAEPLLRDLLHRLAAIRRRANSRLATVSLAALQHQAESSLGDCLWMRAKKKEAHQLYRRAYHSLVTAAPHDSLRPLYFHNAVYTAEQWQPYLRRA